MKKILSRKNLPDWTDITGVIQTAHAFKTPKMQELIGDMTPYNTRANRNTWIISRTGIDGSTPYSSGSGTSDVAICTSPTPPSVCNWSVSIRSIGQTVTGTSLSFRYIN